jgi:DNA-binding CsgD family transcriptional regulator
MNASPNAMGEQVLLALGLDTVCVQVYLMMHEAPDADSGQIAQRLGLQVSEVVDAIDDLADLTLLRPGLAPSSRLRPVSIERGLHTLLRQQSDQLKAQSDSLALLQSAMKELLAARQAPLDALGHVDIETLTGTEAMQTRLEELILRATDSMTSLQPGGPRPREHLEMARQFDEDLSQRGLRARTIYQNAVKNDRRNMEYVRWLDGLGVQVRFAPVVPFRLVLLDRDTAILVHRLATLPHEMFIVREPALLAPLFEYAELCWTASEPLVKFEPRDPNADAPPNSQELALLQLLAGGSTDEAAAKKLGVSVRTVRRMMADLMERLGATSRFEAGHRATQRGWL